MIADTQTVDASQPLVPGTPPPTSPSSQQQQQQQQSPQHSPIIASSDQSTLFRRVQLRDLSLRDMRRCYHTPSSL